MGCAPFSTIDVRRETIAKYVVDRSIEQFGASVVVVGSEDVLGRHLMQLDFVIKPFCSSLKPFRHRGTYCRGAVDALGSYAGGAAAAASFFVNV